MIGEPASAAWPRQHRLPANAVKPRPRALAAITHKVYPLKELPAAMAAAEKVGSFECMVMTP